jgi:hypothetical protein
VVQLLSKTLKRHCVVFDWIWGSIPARYYSLVFRIGGVGNQSSTNANGEGAGSICPGVGVSVLGGWAQ